jgi:hypothetical protein
VARTEIRLAKPVLGGARLRGRVVDEQGAPIPGAAIRLMRKVEELTPHGLTIDRLVGAGDARTSGDGRFEVRRLKAGPHFARLTAPGFAVTRSPSVDVGADEDVRAPDWVMPLHGRVVRGRVTDVAGSPVAGLRVSVVFQDWSLEGQGPIQLTGGTTDAEGHYEASAPAGPPCGVEVHAKSEEFVLEQGKGRADPVAVVDLRMRRSVRLRGPIAFRGPVPQKVAVKYRTEVELSHGKRQLTWYERIAQREASGDEWSVAGIPPGPRAIFFEAVGYAPTEPEEIDLEDGGAGTWKPVQLTPGGTLAARIFDAEGKPVVARVFIKGPWFLYTDSRGDGRLRLEHLPPGARTFTVDRLDNDDRNDPEFAAAIVEGKTTQVEWTLPLAGTPSK